MKILVVYYSRTGTTRKVAEEVSHLLRCGIEEVLDTKNRSGILGWLSAGRDAGSKRLTEIGETKRNPALYDVVIVGTPVWNGTVSAPIRTYITQYRDSFKNVAFFCTQEGTENRALREMESICGKKPIAQLELMRKQEVETGEYIDKVRQFTAEISNRTE